MRGGYNADIMHPCTYSVNPFVEAKIAKPIDTSKLSNWPDIFPTLKTVKGVVAERTDGHGPGGLGQFRHRLSPRPGGQGLPGK